MLNQLPAKVSSMEHCQLAETQCTLYLNLCMVVQGRGGEVTQGQSGPTWTGEFMLSVSGRLWL